MKYILLIILISWPVFSLAEDVNISAIVPGCGDFLIGIGEECDGSNLNGASCGSRGFLGGVLSCSISCTFNTSQCTSSGGSSPVFFSGFPSGGGGASNSVNNKIQLIEYFEVGLASRLRLIISELKGLVDNILATRAIKQSNNVVVVKTDSSLNNLEWVKNRIINNLKNRLIDLRNFFSRALVKK